MSLFITFEGADGSGKTTIANLIYEKLKLDYKILRTREPGGTNIGEKLRDILLDNENTDMDSRTEALIYAASRAQHVSEKIRPALDDDFIVLCERFVLSSIAYQGIGRNLSINDIKSINEFATDGLEPDIIFVFVTDGKSHIRKLWSNPDRLENSGDEFHNKISNFYSNLKSEDNLYLIDASKDVDAVFKQCMQVIWRFL